MKIVRRLVALFPLIALVMQAQIPTVGNSSPGPVKAPHLSVELVALEPAFDGGRILHAGLYFSLDPGWHVYWTNAGDSGEPPSIKWKYLPANITQGAMQYPLPERLPLGPLMDFGYEGQVVFPVELTATPPLARGNDILLKAQVDWLVCREVCLPGRAFLGLQVNPFVDKPIALGRSEELFKNYAVLPQPLPPTAHLQAASSKTEFVITLTTGQRIEHAEFYPFDQEQIANAAQQPVEPLSNGIRIHVKKDETLTKDPAQLHGLIKLSDKLAYEVIARVTAATKTSGSTSEITALPAIGLAFLGGIILNLMPCVFPVLFLKGLALVQSSGEERNKLRAQGLVYTLGILVSFWIIVAVLLVLRASGAKLGWGFQLQSPAFIAVLSGLLFFFALSLAGMFDIGLSITSAGGSLAQKSGYTGSFFTGVLATVVATPCTAPLMGAAVGFALAQSAGITFAVFTAIALGLATPYLALSFQPAWTNILPKPGAWMEVLKQITAIPLFATVIWLVWVYGQLFSGGSEGVNAMSWLLLALLALAIAGWVLGRWPAKWGSAIAALCIVILAMLLPLTHHPSASASGPKVDNNLIWQPYSPEALAQARSSGKPVFVDFTAAWCLSCHVNEALVLNSSEVQERFRTGKVVLLKADWTREDPQITAALGELGRSGVPTYAIYPAGAGQPDVLPELLSKSVVLSALDRDLK